METANNWNTLLEERGNYHPENEYFMVDYMDWETCSHIRLPFLRQEQMLEVCATIQSAIAEGADIRNFRVMPEKFLDMKPFEGFEGLPEVDREYTERVLLFGSRYQRMAERFRNNECFFQKNLK